MIRILSDLHWGHKASRIKHVDSLRPLISESDTVIFNGDTIEQIYEDSPAHKDKPLPSFDALKRKIASWGTRSIFVTGNHDPAISPAHYCELNQGSILITHGDAIFDSVAPWSQHSALLEQLVAQGKRQQTNDERASLYQYLQIFKSASKKQHAQMKDYDPTAWGKIQIFFRQAWPPTRVFKILDSWKQAPARAVDMVAQFKTPPEFLIIGHTHKPDISTQGATTVLNSGSFFPWPGTYAIDIESDGIRVRKVHKRNGEFVASEPIRQFKLSIDVDSLKIPVGEVAPAKTQTPLAREIV